MSCGSQCNTVKRSSKHKCSQKSSCSAFNAMAVALSQIFPSSQSSNMFVMLAPSSGVSWKVTLSDRICIRSALGLSEEIFLLGTPFPIFPLEYYFRGLWTQYSHNCLFVLGPINILSQSPMPNIQFWALIPTTIIKKIYIYIYI